MDKEKELENIAELQKIVDKEILKTLEWITFVTEENRSKTNLRTALDKATAILDYLNKLQNILGKIEIENEQRS